MGQGGQHNLGQDEGEDVMISAKFDSINGDKMKDKMVMMWAKY